MKVLGLVLCLLLPGQKWVRRQSSDCPGGICPAPTAFRGANGTADWVSSPPSYGPSYVPIAGLAAPAEEWRQNAEEADSVGHFFGGVQVGAYRISTGKYYPRRGASFGDAAAVPATLPGLFRLPAGEPAGAKAAPGSARGEAHCQCGPECQCRPTSAVVGFLPQEAKGDGEIDPKLNFGLDVKKLAERKEKYTINGRKADKEEVFQALASPFGAEDDSQLNRLTVIGSQPQCDAALKLMDSPELAAEKGKVLVQCYLPDNPMIRELGFAKGDPSIYLQQPNGKVLARFESLPPGEKLAEAIRKKDPNYDPAKDEQPLKPKTPDPAKPGGEQTTMQWIFVGAAALILWLVNGKRGP